MSHVSCLMSHVLRRKTIGIIGAGNMGQALIKGLIQTGVAPKRLAVVEAESQRAHLVARRTGVRAVALSQAARECEVVILAVKPQDLAPVLIDLREQVLKRRHRVLIISIAAGGRLPPIENALRPPPLVRGMAELP